MPLSERSDAGGSEKLSKAGDLPLSRIMVIDLTIARAGPTCVRHLADWGANVIRVEPAANEGEDVTGARDGPDFQNLHRSKRMIGLNLKSAEGHAAFMRLIPEADVVVENMRPSVKDRLRVNWDDVRAVNPRIVYGSISGFGQDGPYKDRAGVDQIAQGMGGLMSVTGIPGQGPLRVGVPIADLTAGNLLALGIMIALFEREATGVGRWVQTSLLETQTFMLDFQAARWLMKGEVAGQTGNMHPTSTPSGVFPTADGFINLSAMNGRHWARLCDLIDQPDWKAKEEWRAVADRTRDREIINSRISQVTRTRSSAYWTDRLEENGIPCGPIYSIDQVFSDPQVRHLGMAQAITHPRLGNVELVASPMQMSGLTREIRSPTHDAGADTTEILREQGYSDQEIADLRSKRAVA